jgi:hypothetical protein
LRLGRDIFGFIARTESFSKFEFFCIFLHDIFEHGNEIQKESGGGGVGAAGRIEGRASTGGENDAGATQGGGPQSGAGAVVKKEEKGLNYC